MIKSFSGAAALLLAGMGVAEAQDNPEARVMGYVTNAYVADFAQFRSDIAHLEVAAACGLGDRLGDVAAAMLGDELRLRRELISRLVALEAPGLPDAAQRRVIATSTLDALSVSDATTRVKMLSILAPEGLSDEICQAAVEAITAPPPE